MKVGFVSAVELGLVALEEIYNIGHKVDLLITLRRKKNLTRSGYVDFKKIKNKNKFKLILCDNINDDYIISIIKKRNITHLFVIGWSQLLNFKKFNNLNLKIFGIHPSPLPIGRGRAPIPNTILLKLNITAVTLFEIDSGTDSGPIIDQLYIPIKKRENATNLYSKVLTKHKNIIKKNFSKIISNKYNIKIQNDKNATYWPKRKPQDGLINLEGSVYEADLLVRACCKPYPGAFIQNKNTKVIIWKSKIIKHASKVINKPNYLEFIDGYLKLIEYESHKIV